MSRRDCLPTWAVLLGAALLPGCASSPAGTRIDPRDHIPDLPEMRAHAPESPYHPQPDAPPAQPDKSASTAHHERAPLQEDPPPLTAPSPAGDPPKPPPRTAASVTPPPPPEGKKNTPPDEPLVVALRAYLQKRPADALAALGHYDKANQDMLLVALPFAVRLTQGNIDRITPDEAAKLADLLQGVEDHLRQRAALHIEKMLCCRQIDDFGDFVPREPVNGTYTFEGGTGDQLGELVQVYVELRNVSSRRRGESYETRLAGSIKLLDIEGNTAYSRDFTPKPHRGQSPRHDFFVNCSFFVPRKVPPGRYMLCVEVRDITGLDADPAGPQDTPPMHRIAREKLELQVTAPGAGHAAAGSSAARGACPTP
jgi:hypothetical protein